MSVAAAAAALRDADEALGAARVIRDQCHEELVAACVAGGWRILFRHKEAGHERVVLEDAGGRSGNLEDVVAATLREGAAA
jgi:hypothetical protein